MSGEQQARNSITKSQLGAEMPGRVVMLFLPFSIIVCISVSWSGLALLPVMRKYADLDILWAVTGPLAPAQAQASAHLKRVGETVWYVDLSFR
jgi:hypothetical protein